MYNNHAIICTSHTPYISRHFVLLVCIKLNVQGVRLSNQINDECVVFYNMFVLLAANVVVDLLCHTPLMNHLAAYQSQTQSPACIITNYYPSM